MGTIENQIKIMEMLAINEEAVSQLYRAYAEKFPEHKDFWVSISLEEIDHARWIREIESRIKEGKAYFDDSRIKLESVKVSIDYVNGQIAKAKTQPMMPRAALFIAADLENSIIESKWFNACESDSLEFKRLVFDLDQATTRHREELQKIMR